MKSIMRMKSFLREVTFLSQLWVVLMCMIIVSSCFKSTDLRETSNPGHLSHKTIDTKSFNTNVGDYIITKDMIRQFLLGYESYKDSIKIIESYPSELNNLLYLINFNQGGWIILPSDSRFGVVLAESEEGTLNLSKDIENDNFSAWLSDIMKGIEYARGMIDFFGEESVLFWNSLKRRDKSSIEKEIDENAMTLTRSLTPGEPVWGKVLVSTSTTTTITANKNHLLQTKWGQGYPWNKSMPLVDTLRSLAGCAAVAVAQVLYYYNNLSGVPSGMYHSISLTQYNSNRPYSLLDEFNVLHVGYYQQGYLNRSNYVYNSPHWSEMPLINVGGTETQYKYVSDLLLDVGIRLGMFYSPWDSIILVGSNGSYFDITSCFSSANWKQYQSSADAQTVFTELDLNEPTIITSQGYDNGSQVGHTWVIDGYQIRHHDITRCYAWYPFEDIPDDEPIYQIASEDHLLSIYPSLLPGMTVFEYPSYNEQFFRMNWGYNGLHDNSLYTTIATTPWLDTYSFSKGIHYHFTPGELIIQ